MKATKVVPMKMYQHPYATCHAYTMCPVWNMLLSFPYTALHALHADQYPIISHTHLPDQFDAAYLSTMTVWTPQLVPALVHQNPQIWKISRQYLLMMNFWSTEMAPECTLCIHENELPNNICSYPCPYGHNGTASYIDSLDLSDISDLENHFLTTSDEEDLPALASD